MAADLEGEEQVGVVDDTGAVVDVVARSLVRRDNLPHQVVAILVRDSAGRVYVHRRAETKDVFPGLYDGLVAGTVTAGEDLEDAARRELAEELGIRDVELLPRFSQWYADEHTRHLAHVWSTTWDGPVELQREEIAWGGWLTVEDLEVRLQDPHWPFVPDGRALLTTLGFGPRPT
jgi:isopentenyldiphosphate isomerase